MNSRLAAAFTALAAIVLAPALASAQPAGPTRRHGHHRAAPALPAGAAPVSPAAGAAPTPATPPAPVQPPPPAKHAAAKAPAKPKDTSPPLPAPDVKVTLDAPSRLGPWTVRVANTGPVPLRLVADARLVALDVLPRSATKPVHCELPADMRPTDDMDSPLVLPPGRSYAERFQPRLYCFGGRSLDALTPGAIVVAHFGWTGGNKTRPPFALQSIEGVEPELAPQKTIDSAPIALPDDPSPALSVLTAPVPDDPDPAKLAIKGPAAVDATSAANISIDVALHNDGKRPVTVRFRPETLRFEVSGPSGVEDCRWPALPVAAMRELFTTLQPGATANLAVLLADYCPNRAFDEPGLLVVRPEMDTRKASGADIALRTFDGQVIATTPTVIRLHQGLKAAHLARPRLEAEEQPASKP